MAPISSYETGYVWFWYQLTLVRPERGSGRGKVVSVVAGISRENPETKNHKLFNFALDM
jgi:hypothetical protein